MNVGSDNARPIRAGGARGRPTWGVIAALAAAGAAAGCDAQARSATPDPRAATDTFSIVALPDTQYYAAQHPEILDAQTAWIVSQRATYNILLVVHEGDIVDDNDAWQWTRAANSLHVLDRVVPYTVSPGNHDYARRANRVSRDSLIDRYFPLSGFAWDGSIVATFERQRIENSARVIDAPGGPWLILSLEFGPRDGVLAWADQIVKRHAAMPTIVVTHAYLYSDGTRYDHVTRPDQLWNPHLYLDDAAPGGVNDGEEIWRKLIARNPNISFVLCGHDLESGVARLASARPDGSVVQQVLANYQMAAGGGDGYLRLMRFFPSERRVEVRTYSPYLRRFKSNAANEFELDY